MATREGGQIPTPKRSYAAVLRGGDAKVDGLASEWKEVGKKDPIMKHTGAQKSEFGPRKVTIPFVRPGAPPRPSVAVQTEVKRSYDRVLDLVVDEEAGKWWTWEIPASEEGGFENMKRYAEENEKVLNSVPAWRVVLNLAGDPNREFLNKWESAILRSAKHKVVDCKAIRVNKGLDTMEFVFDGPMIIHVGSFVEGRKVMASEPMLPYLSVIKAKWIRKPDENAALHVDEILLGSKAKPIISVLEDNMITAVVSACPSRMLGNKGVMFMKFKGMKSSTAVWHVFKSQNACFKCGAEGHVVSKCAAIWSTRPTETPWKRISTREFFKGNVLGETTKPNWMGVFSLISPEPAAQEGENGMEVDGKDLEKPNLINEVAKRNDLYHEMATQQKKKVADSMSILRAEPSATATDQELEDLAVEKKKAATFMEGIKDGVTLTTEQARADVDQKLVRAKVRESILKKELVVLECGGKGDCGPLAVIGALAAAGVVPSAGVVETLRAVTMSQSGRW